MRPAQAAGYQLNFEVFSRILSVIIWEVLQ
jgi:hypothetical protein